MGHDAVQALLSILGTLGTGALLALARYGRKLYHELKAIGGLTATVDSLSTTVSSLQDTVDSLDRAVTGRWYAAQSRTRSTFPEGGGHRR